MYVLALCIPSGQVMKYERLKMVQWFRSKSERFLYDYVLLYEITH